MSYVFSSESATEGYSDRIADKITNAILDAILEKDPKVGSLEKHL